MEDRLIDKLIDFIDDASHTKEKPSKKWDEVKRVFNGEYDNPHTGAVVRSQKLYTKTRELISRVGLPANFKFITKASNLQNDIDVASAKTAQAHLKYYWRHQNLHKVARQVLTDAILYDRGYARVGFRPGISEEQMTISGDAMGTSDYEGIRSIPGQPYVARVSPWNFFIEDGFYSIDDAYRTGGRLAIRSDVHIDWIKGNEEYSVKARGKVKPDVPYRGMDPELETGKERDPLTKQSPGEDGINDYCILHEIYEAPSPKYPLGRYFVIHRYTEVILYRQDSLPYKGIGFPIRELVFSEPQDCYYGIPLAYRALNSLYEYEFFETKVLTLVAEMKHIISVKRGADAINEQISKVPHFAVVNMENFDDGQPPRDFQFNPDTTMAERASLRSEARFGETFSPEVISPLTGEKVATEMRLKSAGAIQEANDQKIYVCQFWEDVARDLLVLTKTNTSEDEQLRITRMMGMTIQDQDAATLEGDYALEIQASPLLDMTKGDEMNLMNMLMSQVVQLSGLPQYADKLNAMPIIKEWLESMGRSPVDVVLEGSMENPSFENSMLVTGMPIQAHPTDNHMKHIPEHLRYQQQLMEILKNMPQLAQLPPNQINLTMGPQEVQMAIDNVQKHMDMHIAIGDQQSQGSNMSGAWKQMKNSVNMARQAGGASMGAAGAASVQGAGGLNP